MSNFLLPAMTTRLHRTTLQLALCVCSWGVVNAASAQAAAQPAEPAASAATSLDNGGAQRAAFTTLKEKISYATGIQAARNLTTNNIPFDPDILLQGVKDALEGNPPRMNEKEMRVVLQSMQGQIHRNMVSNRAELSLKNLNKGNAYRAEYKNKPDVQELTGGILYRVLHQGSGDMPRDEDIITVRYRGATVDGLEFDATERDSGNLLQMGQTILGWRQALKHMPVGSHWEIVIPPNLAYGDRGVGTSVGPNETVIYNVELLATRHPD